MRKVNILRENPVFTKIWLAQLISLFGDVFYDVAIVWYLVEKTGSALLAGGIAICSLFGKIFGSAIISQHIDKMATRKTMLFADILRATIIIGVLISMLFFDLHLIIYYLLSFIISFLTACFTPARGKSITETVKTEDIPNANAYDSLSVAIAQILSWILGGVIVAVFGVTVALVIDVLSFVISALFIFSAKWTSIVNFVKTAKKNIELVNAFRIIKKSQVLKSVVIFELLYMFMMGFYWASLPIKIEEIGNGFFYGLQGAAFGVGALITSLFLKQRINKRIGTLYLIGIFMNIAGNLSAATSQFIYIFMLGVFVAGMGYSYWQVAKNSLFQLNTSKTDLGKVLSVIEMLTSLILVPAWALGGYLSDIFSPTTVMSAAAILQAIAFIFLIFNKSIKEFEILAIDAI